MMMRAPSRPAPADWRGVNRATGREQLSLPALLVQEGGYNLEALGACARGLFEGLAT